MTIYMLEPAPERTTLTPEFQTYLCPQGWLGQHLEWVCKTTHAPPIFHLVAGLAFAAFELARRGWWLDGVTSNYKAPFLWAAAIADSGEGKGVAISRIRLLDNLATKKLPMMLQDGRCTEEGSLFPIRGSSSGVLADLEKRIYADGVGGERTCGFLVNDEFEVILELVKRNPEFAATLIEAHDQNTLIFRQRNIQKEEDGERKGWLPNPALSTVFVSTRQMMADVYSERLLHGGFSSRFFWISPKDWKTFWPDEPPLRLPEAELVADAFVRWVERIGGDRKPENCRIVFPREGEVREMHQAWSLELHERQPRGNPNRSLYVPRLAHNTAAIACLIAAIETDGLPFNAPITVGVEHYLRAKNLAIESYQSIPTLVALSRSTEVRQDDDMVLLVRDAGRKGLIARDVVKATNKDLQRVGLALRAAEQMHVLVCLGVKEGAIGRPRQVWFHTEYAPPPALRKPTPAGNETIDAGWYTRWSRGEDVPGILANPNKVVRMA